MPHPSTPDAARAFKLDPVGERTDPSMEVLDPVMEAPDRPQQRPTPVYPGEHPRTAPGATREEEGGGRGRHAHLAPAAAAGACPRRGTAPPPRRGPPVQGLPRPGGGRAEPPRLGPSSPGACHAAAATAGMCATGPALAKREGKGGLEERRARERGVCAVNQKPDIYLVLSRSGSNRS
jgi:hypothetical protein